MMPIFDGSMRHFSAFRRTRRIACCPSEVARRITLFSSWLSGAGLAFAYLSDNLILERSIGAILSESPVFNKRYLRTKAANPCLFNHMATLFPSPSRLNMRNAPPGQTIIAAPLAMDGSGRYAVMVGLTTFCVIDPPPGKEEVFSW